MDLPVGVIFLIIAAILIFVFNYSNRVDLNKFIVDTEPYFRFLMESDYEFLLKMRYGSDVNVEILFSKRVRDGMLIMAVAFFYFITKLNFINILISIAAGYFIFKSQYSSLKGFYKKNLYTINLMLPYYLKGLEILIQHYTVPVALRRSIDTAPEIFKVGLKNLVAKIESGDSSVDPYMDFAKEYPVRDSMRMMRLLYRLGLGSQENKEEQLMMFSRTISTLQNKSREQKYKERLDKMEQKTMLMLFVTGGGVLGLMLFSMMMLMNY